VKLDNFTAWVQAILSVLFLAFTFTVILIYELGLAKLSEPGQEKTFDSMVNWMTGGALIVLYFWLSRAKANTAPDPETTTTTQRIETVTTPSPPSGDTNASPPPTLPPAAPPAGPDGVRDPER
jgi:hypothetical protein